MPRSNEIAVIDLETSGFSAENHEITEVAVLRFERETGDIIRQFHARVRFDIEKASTQTLEINGYSELAWKDAIFVENAMLGALDAMRGASWGGHNTKFDMRFVRSWAKCAGIDFGLFLEGGVVDTMDVARPMKARGESPSLKLHDLCVAAGISNVGEHTALADCHRTRELYLYCKRRFGIR